MPAIVGAPPNFARRPLSRRVRGAAQAARTKARMLPECFSRAYR